MALRHPPSPKIRVARPHHHFAPQTCPVTSCLSGPGTEPEKPGPPKNTASGATSNSQRLACSLPKGSNVARMCWLCRATGTEGHELSYGRCDKDAPWRSTRVTHESWRSELLDNGQELPSLFQYTRGYAHREHRQRLSAHSRAGDHRARAWKHFPALH